MNKVGDRLVWEDTDAFGAPGKCISLEEFPEGYPVVEKPEGSFIHIFSNDESVKYLYEDFVSRSDDVFICTYAKSGTTWMQQIIFQLLFGPTEDFAEITEESPWLETRMGHNFLVNNKRYPRIIKTHLRFEHLPSRITSQGKFFFIERQMKDVFASYKRHLIGFGVDVSESTLLDAFLSGKLSLGPYDGYIKSWRYKAPTVLQERLKTLSFEDMRGNLEETIRVVAAHLDISLSDEHLKKVAEYSSLEYMKAHADKFNHNAERKLSRELRGSAVPLQGDFSFVGNGKIGTHKTLLDSSIEKLDAFIADKHL